MSDFFGMASKASEEQLATVLSRLEAARERTERAGGLAREHTERARTGPDYLRELHLRMAAIHLRMEQRHLVSVRLYSLMTVRLEQAAEGFAERVRGVPSLVAATAELGESDSAVMVLFDSEQDEALTLASDPTALRAHELEFEVGEGPSVDAVRARAQIAARGEQMLDRWRLYGPEVRGLDVHAVAAAPLQPGAACIGTLDRKSVV